MKRANVIAQTLFPALNGLEPNGPGYGFAMDGSYVKGAEWGDSDPFGVSLFNVNGTARSWTNDGSITGLAGSYPFNSMYISYLEQNPFFWEQQINLSTVPM